MPCTAIRGGRFAPTRRDEGANFRLQPNSADLVRRLEFVRLRRRHNDLVVDTRDPRCAATRSAASRWPAFDVTAM